MRKYPYSLVALSTLLAVAALLSAVRFPVTTHAQVPPVIVGKGCTTVYYIDQDCDGYGVGKKAAGDYTIGLNGNAQSSPLIETMGDMIDADDQDATVHSTAEWEAKWGVGNTGIRAFLTARKSFSNSTRLFYLSATGNDSTAVMSDMAHPYATIDKIYQTTTDFQGGVIVLLAGNYTGDGTQWGFSSNGGTRQASGSSGHRLCIMGYPGARVVITLTVGANAIGQTYTPFAQTGYLLVFGLIFKTTNFDIGDLTFFSGMINTTIEDNEWSGAHELIIVDHSPNFTFRRNVGHQIGHHFLYLGSASEQNYYGSGDVDFPAEQAQWTAGTNVGTASDWDVSENVSYNNGGSGYEAWHFNSYAQRVHFRNNITSYTGGTGITFQTGIYDSDIIGNVFIESAGNCIQFNLYGPEQPVHPSKIKNILVENNTCWAGMVYANGVSPPEVSVRGKGVSGGLGSADTADDPGYSPLAVDVHPIENITVRNNIFAVDNWSSFSGSVALAVLNHSYSNTWTVENNLLWSHSPSSTSAAIMMRSCATCYGGDSDGTLVRSTTAQINSFGFSSVSSNQYGNPQFSASDRTWITTPEMFNLKPSAGSPAIGAASATSAPTTDLLGNAWTGTIGAYQYGNVNRPSSGGSGHVTSAGKH